MEIADYHYKYSLNNLHLIYQYYLNKTYIIDCYVYARSVRGLQFTKQCALEIISMTSLSCVIFLFYLDDKRKGHPQCMLCPILAEICTEQVWRWWFLYCSLPLFINLGKTKPLNFKEIFFNCICVICSARAFAHNVHVDKISEENCSYECIFISIWWWLSFSGQIIMQVQSFVCNQSQVIFTF